jgi:hypothetical protein
MVSLFLQFYGSVFLTKVIKTVKGALGVKWAGMRLSSDELKLPSLIYYF